MIPSFSTMADPASTPYTSNNCSTVAESSHFGRTVCLYDWWLVKAENDFEGKRLAVSGITSRKDKALRVFVSAPVTKRYDVFSLETADGIYIMIKGFINEQRTLESGFPAEVFNKFIFGFPPDWESFAVDCFRHESVTDVDLGSSFPENVSPIDPQVLSDGVGKSTPTSSQSPEEALGAHEKPFTKEECHSSKKIVGGLKLAHGSGSIRRSTRLHNIKVCQQKKPASGVDRKCLDKEQQSSSWAFGNPNGEGLESPRTRFQSRSPAQVNTPSKRLVKNSSSAIEPEVLFDGVERCTTLSKSPKEGLGVHKKPFPEEECDLSKDTAGGANVAEVNGSNRRSSRLHIKVHQLKKTASGVGRKHPDKAQHSSSGALGSPDGEGLESLLTPIQPQSSRQVNTPSRHLVETSSSAIDPVVLFDEKSILASSKSPEEALGAHKNSFPTEECHASKETMGEFDVAHDSGSNRRSTRLHNIKVCQQKPASEVALKHPDKEQQSCAGALGNTDREGLESPTTPFQSQSLAQVNTQSKKLIKNSASRVSRPFSANGEDRSKKQKVITPTRKKYTSSIKYQQEKDLDPLIKGGKEKISSVSPMSSNFRKSRSGRLLLPPLEFWRNQIAIYNADHEVTEIREGASVISPFKGSTPSLNRF